MKQPAKLVGRFVLRCVVAVALCCRECGGSVRVSRRLLSCPLRNLALRACLRRGGIGRTLSIPSQADEERDCSARHLFVAEKEKMPLTRNCDLFGCVEMRHFRKFGRFRFRICIGRTVILRSGLSGGRDETGVPSTASVSLALRRVLGYAAGLLSCFATCWTAP